MKSKKQEYLNYLLEQEKWTIEEKEWMLNYLESNELSDLEDVAANNFNRDIIFNKDTREPGWSKDVLKKIHQRIKAPRPSFLQVVRLHRVKVAVAASVVLLAGLGYLSSKVLDNRFQKESPQQILMVAKERKTVTLPDSSLVTLEPGSVLNYPDRFSGDRREVQLKGEAFFEVTRDTAHPFVIQTEHISTTVLGTSFNVEAYASKETKVVVVTGKVKVETKAKEKQALVLKPNQSVVYSSHTDQLREREAENDAHFFRQRRDGKFVYKGTALEKVVEDLQRYYNVVITIDGGVSKCLLYGDFFAGDSVDKVLKLIAISLNASVKKDTNGKGYLIVGGGCR